jgi:myosin heavy subunit
LAQALLMAALPNAPASDWRVGVSKVFLRQNLATQLESARERQLTAVTIKLQSLARTKIWRARFLKVKGSVHTWIEHFQRMA